MIWWSKRASVKRGRIERLRRRTVTPFLATAFCLLRGDFGSRNIRVDLGLSFERVGNFTTLRHAEREALEL
jgi:hypothetical protein